MNNDRLLTRIFDKQEKKMLYSAVADYIGIGNDCFVTTNRGDIIVTVFKDRYVPMMCYGEQDKNKKLIYDGDIAKYKINVEKFANHIDIENKTFIKTGKSIIRIFEGCWCVMTVGEMRPYSPSFSEYSLGMYNVNAWNTPFEDLEIIGNRWEHPEIMEAKA